MKLKKNALDWALNHVTQHGDTDIFPVPFEYEAIRAGWKGRGGIQDWLSSQDVSSWTTRPSRRCLAPKHRYSFRLATQLDPLDTLVFLGLVKEIGKELEARRVPKTAGIVHSHRFAPKANGQFFDPKYNFESFRQKCISLDTSGKW